ncbi:hypothetical protein CCH79_00020027 [Gambusia affinis]|uniref:Uncharacterized protein n=1 Tax=Gambusia affinis TaxID=33528 RepID=A0A315W6C7_GAMAF|nr:hypothetical protein CCH79_00020027 [Gambusia affinis]
MASSQRRLLPSDLILTEIFLKTTKEKRCVWTRKHPDSPYEKRSAAKCYTKQILSHRSNPDPRRITEAIGLWEEVIAAYPESSLQETLDLQTKGDNMREFVWHKKIPRSQNLQTQRLNFIIHDPPQGRKAETSSTLLLESSFCSLLEQLKRRNYKH